MITSKNGQPLYTLTDKELRGMGTSAAAQNIVYSVNDIRFELMYREQRHLACLTAVLIGGTLVANILALAANAFL